MTKFEDLYPSQILKIQAVLSGMEKPESYLFNKDVNPISKNRTTEVQTSGGHTLLHRMHVTC
ncbi:CFC_HP_G0068300.mRNA.1.CDS.1 [Saccharomyces cerevisiae]|nr:CFC_HP_G0068300.mRNA.1.CDS.1 [Saccharomyces cerevisiae]CAI6648350.1 CFC_HP_G0068300.mRNA.1.CDS.1 [Saccharomyces cerevisiae]